MATALEVYVLRIIAQAETTIDFEEHAGSALRGVLFHALLRRFCMNPRASACADCPLNSTCPVAGLVAPLRDENPRGRDVPRPFVLSQDAFHLAPAARRRNIEPGQTLSFTLSLFGRAIQYWPYVALSMPTVELLGIGRPLRANGGRRGHFQVERIELVNSFSGETQPLFQRGSSLVAAPTIAITAANIAARAATMPADQMTIHFLTPTRLIRDGQLMRQPDFQTFILRLLERLDALEQTYGMRITNGEKVDQAETEPTPDDSERDHEIRLARRQRLSEAAQAVQLTNDQTRWVDVVSYSSRQKRSTPIGGFVGTASYTGDLIPLRELLVWGEVLHVGKNAVKGNGLYNIAN
jgi:hypothetical protein